MMQYPEFPCLAVGAVVFFRGRVLLVRRKNPPAQGTWAIPGGRVELGETLQQAAEREVFEETGIVIRAGAPVLTLDVIDTDDAGRIRFHYVIIDLAADYIRGRPIAGDDALAVRWFSPEALETAAVNRSTRQLLQQRLHFGKNGQSP